MSKQYRYVTFEDIENRLSQLGLTPDVKAYGVPRGGVPISMMLTPVATVVECDIIIDDIIDSGATRERITSEHPSKPFYAIIDKQENPDPYWYVFPWENGLESPSVEDNVQRILQAFDNPLREGLQQTPMRYVKFLREFLNPDPFKFTAFSSEGMNEMIVVKDIPFYSLCEHHLAPFFGHGHIGYIPNGKIVGLSKLPRVLDHYARRFQNQERITQQVAQRIQEELHCEGVAVVLEAEHLCMTMRGIKKAGAKTVTSKMLGRFFDDHKTRKEFMDIIGK